MPLLAYAELSDKPDACFKNANQEAASKKVMLALHHQNDSEDQLVDTSVLTMLQQDTTYRIIITVRLQQ